MCGCVCKSERVGKSEANVIKRACGACGFSLYYPSLCLWPIRESNVKVINRACCDCQSLSLFLPIRSLSLWRIALKDHQSKGSKNLGWIGLGQRLCGCVCKSGRVSKLKRVSVITRVCGVCDCAPSLSLYLQSLYLSMSLFLCCVALQGHKSRGSKKFEWGGRSSMHVCGCLACGMQSCCSGLVSLSLSLIGGSPSWALSKTSRKSCKRGFFSYTSLCLALQDQDGELACWSSQCAPALHASQPLPPLLALVKKDRISWKHCMPSSAMVLNVRVLRGLRFLVLASCHCQRERLACSWPWQGSHTLYLAFLFACIGRILIGIVAFLPGSGMPCQLFASMRLSSVPVSGVLFMSRVLACGFALPLSSQDECCMSCSTLYTCWDNISLYLFVHICPGLLVRMWCNGVPCKEK